MHGRGTLINTVVPQGVRRKVPRTDLFGMGAVVILLFNRGQEGAFARNRIEFKLFIIITLYTLSISVNVISPCWHATCWAYATCMRIV